MVNPIDETARNLIIKEITGFREPLKCGRNSIFWGNF